jgi:hypothetical protein
MEIEGRDNKQGLPPRDRNADVPEHATSTTTWVMGAIAVFAVLGLVLFGTSRTNDITASNPNLNTEQGMTTGATPSSPQKRTE